MMGWGMKGDDRMDMRRFRTGLYLLLGRCGL